MEQLISGLRQLEGTDIGRWCSIESGAAQTGTSLAKVKLTFQCQLCLGVN